MEIFGVPVILIIFVVCAAWATIKYERKKKIEFAWSTINNELLTLMKQRLGTEFKDFANTCEEIGLMQNFLSINERLKNSRDINFACFLCASAVVSAANYYGSQLNLSSAKSLANWAIKLEPNHVPALMCLANIYQLEGDVNNMNKCYFECENIKRRIMNKQDSDLETHERALLNMF